MSKLTVVKIGTDTPAGAPFTMNRYVNASGFKLVINGTGTNIFELTTGAAGATRRFAFASSGQYTMDAYGVGAFTGIATKWLSVTAAGLVIEENPPTGATYAFSNYITESGGAVKLGGVGVDAITTLTADEKQILITFNSLAGTSGLKLTSTSTVAAGGLQKMLEITLSGANANASQTSYAAYFSNTHTGTTPTNYALFAVTTGSGSAIRGEAGIGNGVTGIATGASTYGGYFESAGSGGTGIYGQANVTNGIGVWGSSTNIGGQFNVNHSSTNTLVNVVRLFRTSSATPANGLGGSLDFYNEASDNSSQLAARIGSTWTDVTVGTRTGDLQFWTTNSAVSALKMTISGNGNVGIGATASADGLLELTSTTKAFIIMRMTSAQAGAITAANGMMLYVTDTDATFTAVGVWAREAGVWVKL